MADDNSGNKVGEPTESALQSTATDRSQILAQATRFLTHAKISESASDDDKREFLRSKGLSEDEITRAFQDAKSPVDGGPSAPPHTSANPSQPDGIDAFELAARQFDDPINADRIAPPPKSYPNSPLALYYDPPAAQHATQPSAAFKGSQPVSPLTRYQVLLQFFRTLSYMMMLGGGVTALVVSLYRAYILPKITAMFDARSIVLKHHIVLFDKLRSNVSSLATYVPIQHARIGAEDSANATANAASPLKGVLKRVHFNDQVDASADGDKEGVKSTQIGSDVKSATATEKVVMPGTDVVVDAKTPLLAEERPEGSEVASNEDGGEASQPATAPKLEPIDLMSPIRQSMARLAEVLKEDLCGRRTEPAAGTAAGASRSHPRSSARSATVADAGSGSDEWEDEDEDDAASEDDDGLEFDPYGAYQKKLKHTQSSSSSSINASSGSASTSLTGLKTALVSLNADISTHAFAANSSGSSMGSAYGAFRFGPGASDSAGSGSESPKSGDLAQVKAEIRSLKGLLLSRRNFPSYGARPPPLPNAAGAENRTTSAVV